MSTEINNKNQSSRQIKYGALMSYTAVFVNIIAGMLFTPWMIRQIGQADYGLYALALSVIMFFTIDFGLGESVSRFLSKYNAENQVEKKRDFLGVTFKLYIVIDMIIFIALLTVFLLADTIYSELTPEELEKFKIVFIIAAFYALGSFPFQPLNGILISHERFVFLKAMDLFHRLLTVITMIVVLLLGFRLYGLVIVNALTGFIAIILKIHYIFRKNKMLEINFSAWDKRLLKELFSFSIWIAIIVFSQRFIFTITPSVLGAFSGTAEIAVFSIASTMEGYVWMIASALNGLFLPKVTSLLLNKNAYEEVEALMIKVGRIQLIIVGLLYAGFLTLGKDFVELWLGNNFSSAYIITLLLITPSLVVLTQQIANTALVAKNLVKYHCFGVVIMSMTSIVLSIVLSPKLGATGAGIGIFIGTILGGVVVMNLVYSRVLRINLAVFFRECHLKLFMPIVLTILIGFLVQLYFPLGGWVGFLIKVTIVSISYSILIWKLGLNNFEKGLFLGMANNIANSIYKNR
ncbi:Membrane protein involved in the export of O-antigen and teichoic acid [Desulfonispora thiosulfatigenes DSM 11270]|uniref:Membrane protein involved in the export of O-antigen and teichoic acid n=1 Tax=Desulfonispora thiosulfatigenes DSM 11270 TaxID=656914 RepID=A0A1W1V5Y1_DESTI|nr:oligosaccharide flippase family protein [Desulfonispora thiosulfatigenes]SMB88723.1 Membrane protein involved in the export of O-antigen and teichoic acid [Desulfonispora thiosulfatigenes DSM 11270]